MARAFVVGFVRVIGILVGKMEQAQGALNCSSSPSDGYAKACAQTRGVLDTFVGSYRKTQGVAFVVAGWAWWDLGKKSDCVLFATTGSAEQFGNPADRRAF